MALEFPVALLALLLAAASGRADAANATNASHPTPTAASESAPPTPNPTSLEPAESTVAGFLRIQHTTYNTTRRLCLNSTKGNRTLVDDGLFTFNFIERGSALTFQVPRCLFNTSEARTILRGVDTTEDRDAYRHRHRHFFLVPLAGVYRLVEPTRQPAPIQDARLRFPKPPAPQKKNHPGQDTTGTPPRPWSSITVSQTRLALADLHRRHRPHRCAIHGHPALFDLYFNCSRHEVRWGGYGISLNLGPDFFILTAGPWPPSPDRTLGLFFGQPRRLDPKAPYNDASFLLRQTANHDLLAIVRSTVQQQHFPFLTAHDFLDSVLAVRYENITTAIRTTQYLATALVQQRECGRLTRTVIEFFFAYGTMLLSADLATYTDDMPITVPLEREAQMAALGEFAARCFSTGSETAVRPNLTPPPRSTLRRDQTHSTPTDSVFHELANIVSYLPVGTLIDALYVWRHERAEQKDAASYREQLLQQVLRTVERYYHASLVGQLTAAARRDLQRLDGAAALHLNVSAMARRAALFSTVMCSSREFMAWAEYIWRHDLLTPDGLYSPCLNGLRRDYTVDSIRSLLLAEHRPEEFAEPAATLLTRLRADGLRNTHEANCLKPHVPRTVLTASNRTFVVSSQHLLRGPAYPVSNTVVGRTLLVTSLPRRAPCVWNPAHREVQTIGILKNLTLTEACELCHTILLEYDEVDGLTNLIYLGDLDAVTFITDPTNRLLAATPRIHYLVLMNNGTVFEVTDIVVHLTPTPYGAIVAGCLLALVAVLIAWSVCRAR